MTINVEHVVIFGASVMEQSFRNYEDRTAELFLGYGMAVTVYERATSGDTMFQYLSRIDAVIAEFSGLSNVLFVIHGPGNNVSASRPYATALPADLAEIDSGMRDITQRVLDAGMNCALSNITYRNYGDVPPESNGSLPYNDNIINPIIQEKTPLFWNGGAVIDLYSLMLNNPAWLGGDGVHPNALGEDGIRRYIAQQVATVSNSNATPVDPDGPYSPLAGETFIIDAGNLANSNALFNRVNSVAYANLTDLVNTQGQARSIKFTSANWNGESNTGRGNPGDVSVSLTNNELLTGFMYLNTSDIATAVIENLEVGRTGTITLTASRDTTNTDRIGEYTLDGSMQELDAALDPPAQISWPFTVDALGKIPLDITRKAGNTFAYVSGIKYLFDAKSDIERPIIPPKHVMTIRSGEFLISELSGSMSRETVTIVSGQKLLAGTVLGKIAVSGKYTAYSNSASDGSEVASGILYKSINAIAGEKQALAIVRGAEVSGAMLSKLDGTSIADLMALKVIVR